MTDSYEAFAERIARSEVILDPWLFGVPRFRQAPVILDARRAKTLGKVAEEIVATFHEASLLVAESPETLDDFFGLTPAQKTMWLASQPFWHGLARVDVFDTADGPVIAELNCDTPTGEAEAVVLGALAKADHPSLVDPNADFGKHLLDMMEWTAGQALDPARELPRTIGIVYPTEFTEDLSLVRLYRKWLEDAGYGVVLGSPYNLAEDEAGRVTLMGTPIAVMMRHYKTDWWGERSSPWDDEDIPDTRPLEGPLSVALRAQIEGRLAIVNPFGAVVPQNKRMMAFLWENIHRLSARGAEIVEKHVPLTRRLETVHEEQLFVQKNDWVIKSDYGAEGDEVVIGRLVDDDTWRKTIVHARPGRWVAQRYFESLRGEGGEETNMGIYVVAGEVAGYYARMSRGPTDATSLSVPVLVGD